MIASAELTVTQKVARRSMILRRTTLERHTVAQYADLEALLPCALQDHWTCWRLLPPAAQARWAHLELQWQIAPVDQLVGCPHCDLLGASRRVHTHHHCVEEGCLCTIIQGICIQPSLVHYDLLYWLDVAQEATLQLDGNRARLDLHVPTCAEQSALRASCQCHSSDQLAASATLYFASWQMLCGIKVVPIGICSLQVWAAAQRIDSNATAYTKLSKFSHPAAKVRHMHILCCRREREPLTCNC